MFAQYIQLLSLKNISQLFGSLMCISIGYIYPLEYFNYNISIIYNILSSGIIYFYISNSLDKVCYSIKTTDESMSNPSHYYIYFLFLFIYILLFSVKNITNLTKLRLICDLLSYQLYFTQIIYKHIDMALYEFHNIIDFYNNNSANIFYVTIPFCLLKKLFNHKRYELLFLYAYIYFTLPILINLRFTKKKDTVLKTYNFLTIGEYLFNSFIFGIKHIIQALYPYTETVYKLH